MAAENATASPLHKEHTTFAVTRQARTCRFLCKMWYDMYRKLHISKGNSMPRKSDPTPGIPAEHALMNVVRLERPAQLETKMGRKPKLKYPPLPAEIYDSMTELEQQHFEYFIEAIKADNALRPSDYIGLYAAGLEYVAYLRLQASQIASGQLVTMSRQHPGVQLRAWLDTMSFSRRKGTSGKQAEDGLASQLMALSS